MQASAADRLLTTLGELEVINAMQLRVFRKEVSREQAQSSLDDFERHLGTGFSSFGSCVIRSLSGRASCQS